MLGVGLFEPLHSVTSSGTPFSPSSPWHCSASACLWPDFSIVIHHHLPLLWLLPLWTWCAGLPLYHGEHRVGKVSYRLNGRSIAAVHGSCVLLITHPLGFLRPNSPGWQSSVIWCSKRLHRFLQAYLYLSIKTASFSPVCMICFFLLDFSQFPISHVQLLGHLPVLSTEMSRCQSTLRWRG